MPVGAYIKIIEGQKFSKGNLFEPAIDFGGDAILINSCKYK